MFGMNGVGRSSEIFGKGEVNNRRKEWVCRNVWDVGGLGVILICR